jgi:hypothetical protein
MEYLENANDICEIKKISARLFDGAIVALFGMPFWNNRVHRSKHQKKCSEFARNVKLTIAIEPWQGMSPGLDICLHPLQCLRCRRRMSSQHKTTMRIPTQSYGDRRRPEIAQ